MENIIVICENEICGKKLKDEANNLGFNLEFEIQIESNIINEISEQKIKDASAVLFVIDKGIEEINKIERFIDVEYYEVEPSIAITSPHQVIGEIISDIK